MAAMERNINMSKKFMVYVTIEVPVEFADENMTLEEAFDAAHDYVVNDLGQTVYDMCGGEDIELSGDTLN